MADRLIRLCLLWSLPGPGNPGQGIRTRFFAACGVQLSHDPPFRTSQLNAPPICRWRGRSPRYQGLTFAVYELLDRYTAKTGSAITTIATDAQSSQSLSIPGLHFFDSLDI